MNNEELIKDIRLHGERLVERTREILQVPGLREPLLSGTAPAFPVICPSDHPLCQAQAIWKEGFQAGKGLAGLAVTHVAGWATVDKAGAKVDNPEYTRAHDFIIEKMFGGRAAYLERELQQGEISRFVFRCRKCERKAKNNPERPQFIRPYTLEGNSKERGLLQLYARAFIAQESAARTLRLE